MFSGRLSTKGMKTRVASEYSKDFDATEKAIGVVEQMKATVQCPTSFLSLTYNKCRAAVEKIQGRNTEALQKLYRESSQNGDSHGLDLLKRTAETEKQAMSILNFVSALHDAEASASTLFESIGEARSAGVQIPKDTDKLCRARLLNEVSKKHEWDEYFKQLDAVDGLQSMFSDEGEEALLDFQASSIVVAARNILMQEINVDTQQASDDPKADKEALAAEARRKAEELKDKLTEGVAQFVEAFFSSGTGKFMEGKSAVSQLFDDMKKVKTLLQTLAKSKSERLEQSKIDELQAARSGIVSNKKGPFYEAFTLFPLGQAIASRAGGLIQEFHHDKGLMSELDDLLQVVSGLKTFTQDTILKKITKAEDSVDYDIQIPQQSKVFDLVSKCLGQI